MFYSIYFSEENEFINEFICDKKYEKPKFLKYDYIKIIFFLNKNKLKDGIILEDNEKALILMSIFYKKNLIYNILSFIEDYY